MRKRSIVIIPARGNSKGIPRKNLRPVAGKPLIYYSIKAALEANRVHRVLVSTDDEEIALFAGRFGAEIVWRPGKLAQDDVPLDPVIVHAVEHIEKDGDEPFDVIVTVQPTSPLITSHDIDAVVSKFSAPLDTVITATEDRHLRWRSYEGQFVPEYEKRVNRQQLPEVYRETGAIIACTGRQLRKGTRIGERVELHIVDGNRNTDIDSYADLWLCEMLLRRRKICFTVIGNANVGLGHVYRTLLLANELVSHEVCFLCKKSDTLALERIRGHNYPVITVDDNKFPGEIEKLGCDLVINDILDTSSEYVLKLKKRGISVVNFEDMGLGAEVADLVVNALYPHQLPHSHILVGPDFFCLRDEFLHVKPRTRSSRIKRVLLTFGGVDEGNLTCRVLREISGYLQGNRMAIDVVLGPGYAHRPALDKLIESLKLKNFFLVDTTVKISDYMNRADLAIISAGRTVFEVASVGLPAIVIAQNQRETTHTMAASSNGFINLGLHEQLAGNKILETVKQITENKPLFASMLEKVATLDLVHGKKRVIQKILQLLE